MSEHDDVIRIRGDIEITERRILTDDNGNILYGDDNRPLLGDVVGHFEEKNIVLTQGKGLILNAWADIANASRSCVKTIKIGKDVGVGTVLDPQEATANLTEANLDVVYVTPDEEFFVSYPTANSVRFLATINGANVMTNYPTLPNVIYTSASITTIDGKSCTYKRFPARTISELISVDISWTVTIL